MKKVSGLKGTQHSGIQHNTQIKPLTLRGPIPSHSLCSTNRQTERPRTIIQSNPKDLLKCFDWGASVFKFNLTEPVHGEYKNMDYD